MCALSVNKNVEDFNAITPREQSFTANQVSARLPRHALIRRDTDLRADRRHSPGANVVVDQRDDEIQHVYAPLFTPFRVLPPDTH